MKTLFNNQVCKTSDSLQNLRICATTPLMFNEEEFGLFKKLTKICTTKNWGGDAYLYGLLAIGQIDIVCESDLQIYDIAALIPIIEGTGGTVTD
jgi:fructose-1,6-bisphosphatase/inositol monophosphatase family enzyme